MALDSVDQTILSPLIGPVVSSPDILWLINLILKSFSVAPGRGLPLGNVTSQLFANLYLNGLDQFVKHCLGEKFYVRYCDDFVILHRDKGHLIRLVPVIDNFLQKKLGLSLHPDKTSVRKFGQGIDWLGYIVLPRYRVLRTKTRQRIFRRLRQNELNENNLPSYLGVVGHCRGYNLARKMFEKC